MRIRYLTNAPVTVLLLIAASATALARQPETTAKAPADPQTATPAAPPKLTYTCPMHPQIVQAKPGVCPLCRMALKPTKAVAAQATERATNGQTPMDHYEGMSMPTHEDMHGMQMEHGSMCGCSMCMMMMGMGGMDMTGMEGMDHGSAPASAAAKPVTQRSYGSRRSGGRGCGC